MTLPFENSGRIVQTWKDGLRILWTYIPEIPPVNERSVMPWLTVIRWEYDGSGNKGMPSNEENQRMLTLDATLGKVEHPDFCYEPYRRIGAGVREFVYYVADRDRLLQEFSKCATDPRYPISITFYKDEDWSDLQDLINDLKTAQTT
jgi:hypothetical protein